MTPLKKRCELDSVFNLLKAGFTKAQVKKKLNLKGTALANHLRRLEESNNIKRVGKFRVDIISTSYLNPKVTKNKLHKGFNKRGHGHNSTIHFSKKVDLWELPQVKQDKKAKILEELGFRSLKFVRDGFTIWINKHTLTFYSNNSYYSGNALHSKFAALRNIDTLIENLILKYNFPKQYGIEIFREHYGLIFNKFAKWLNKKGKKMYVQDRKGKSILWVDKSRKDDVGLDEFEGEDPMKINSADDFFSSKDKTGWKDDTVEVEKNKKEIANLKGVFPAMKEYNENLKLHTAVQREQLETQKQTQKILKQMEKFFTHTKSKDL